MKYKLNEQQLNNIITNSTFKVLSEAMEDEGLGRFLGDMAGRIRNGINKFTGDFNAARNNRMYQQRDYDSYQKYGYDPNSRNFDTNTARQYQTEKNTGASRTSMGSFQTQYGDTVPGAQPQENPQVAPQNTQQDKQPSTTQNGPQNNPQMMKQKKVGGNQSIDQAAIAKAHGATRKPNRIVPTNQKETTTRKSYMPNQTFTQDSYNQMIEKGQERESRQPKKQRISETKLNRIVSESIRKVLNGK